MGVGTGRQSAMSEAVQNAAEQINALGEGAGSDLFSLPTRFASGSKEAEALQVVARDRKAGRPVGAVNKSTARFREYLLTRGVSPLQQLMQWSMHTPETLAKELGCSKLEAMRELRMFWSELTPYLHARVAPTDDKGQAVPMLSLVFGGGTGAMPGAPTGDVAPWHYIEGAIENIEQNQGLVQSLSQQSHEGNAPE